MNYHEFFVNKINSDDAVPDVVAVRIFNVRPRSKSKTCYGYRCEPEKYRICEKVLQQREHKLSL